MTYDVVFLNLTPANLRFLKDALRNPFSLPGLVLAFFMLLYALWPTLMHRIPLQRAPNRKLRIMLLLFSLIILLLIGILVN